MRIHVIDFEGHPKYGVIEWGVVTLADAQIVAAQTGRCAPTGEIPLAESRIHGLTADALAALPSFATHYDFFVGLRRSGQLAAHNWSVEHGLLKHTWAFPPYAPDWAHPGQEVADWGPWIDTLPLARKAWPQLSSHALTELIPALGLTEPLQLLAEAYCPATRQRPHSALYDALAAALLWQEATAVIRSGSKAARRQSELF